MGGSIAQFAVTRVSDRAYGRDSRRLIRDVYRMVTVIRHIREKYVAQVPLAEDDDMIKAFPPDRANQPFRMAILPSRLGRGWPVMNAHGAKPPGETFTVDPAQARGPCHVVSALAVP